MCEPDELALRLALDPVSLRRKVAALQAQHSQTAGLIEAVGLERFAAWVAVEGFAAPAGVAAGVTAGVTGHDPAAAAAH
jgi:hypothetical protein